MVVDFSGYIGKWPYWQNYHADATGDGLVGLMDKWGVDKSFITSMCSIVYDDALGNEMAFAAVALHPNRFIPTVSISTITNRDNVQYLERCAERGARVLRLYPAHHGYKLSADNAPLIELVANAQRLGMAVSISVRIIMNWALPALPVSNIISFIDNNSDGIFVVDGFNADEYIPLLDYAQKNKRIFLCTTALTRYLGIEHMVARIGSGRILAGFAAPYQYVSCGIKKISNAQLSQQEVDNILGGNSTRLFELT